MNQELLRIVDSIARDKNIDKEEIFMDIEAALLSAARKFYGEADDVACAPSTACRAKSRFAKARR